MKLVIKPECKVGPLTLKIRWNDRVLWRDHSSAHVFLGEEIIRLSHGVSPEFTFYQLIHEGLHAIRKLHGLEAEDKVAEENEVLDLSTGITAFLLSLGIEPDFSQIPEEEPK